MINNLINTRNLAATVLKFLCKVIFNNIIGKCIIKTDSFKFAGTFPRVFKPPNAHMCNGVKHLFVLFESDLVTVASDISCNYIRVLYKGLFWADSGPAG